MADQLTSGQALGAQGSTQNPQSVPTGDSGVQPTTSTDLLNGSNGIALNQPKVPTIGLGNTAQTSSQTVTTAPAAHHHVDSALLTVPGALLVLALVAFWITGTTVKSTTDY